MPPRFRPRRSLLPIRTALFGRERCVLASCPACSETSRLGNAGSPSRDRHPARSRYEPAVFFSLRAPALVVLIDGSGPVDWTHLADGAHLGAADLLVQVAYLVNSIVLRRFLCGCWTMAIGAVRDIVANIRRHVAQCGRQRRRIRQSREPPARHAPAGAQGCACQACEILHEMRRATLAYSLRGMVARSCRRRARNVSRT